VDEAVGEFVIEAREGVEALDRKLVDFERDAHDAETLADIFRLFHSLKGAAGFLGFTRLQALGHAAENLLGAFRDGVLSADAAAVSAILQALDTVRDILDGLDRTGSEPPGDDRALIARLDAIFEGAATADTAPPAASLLERLGGESTLDAACECALGRLIADPATGAAFAGVNLDLL